MSVCAQTKPLRLCRVEECFVAVFFYNVDKIRFMGVKESVVLDVRNCKQDTPSVCV